MYAGNQLDLSEKKILICMFYFSYQSIDCLTVHGKGEIKHHPFWRYCTKQNDVGNWSFFMVLYSQGNNGFFLR